MRRLTLLSLLLLYFSTGVFALEYIRPYKRGNKIIFSFKDPQKKVKRAYLMGTMNDWNYQTLPMQRSVLGNRFFIALDMEPGRYEYKYMVNAFLFQDMSNPLSVDDGFSRANSLVFIDSNRQLDWDHSDRSFALEDGTWQLMESYVPDLSGYYVVSNLTIRITNMDIILKSGWVRLVETEKGVTGLVFWGHAELGLLKRERHLGTGVYMRFHPRFYEDSISEQLIKIQKSREHMYCNNLFYLKDRRFYSMAEQFMIPPEGFVGVSINNEFYQKEKIFTAFRYTFRDPAIPLKKSGMVQPKDITRVELEDMLPMVENWIEALAGQDITRIKADLYQPIMKGVEQTAMHIPGLAECKLVEGSVRVWELEKGQGSIVLQSPRYVTMEISTQTGKKVKSRLLIARVQDQWKIMNYTLTF